MLYNHLFNWLHFVAYGASCVLSNIAIDDGSVVVVMATIGIGCFVSAKKTPVNPKFYDVKEKQVLWRGGLKKWEGALKQPIKSK